MNTTYRLTLAAVLMSAVLIAVQSCCANEARLPAEWLASTHLASDVFEPVAGVAAVTLEDDLPTEGFAHARIVQPPSICDVSGGLPIVVPPKTRPIVGQEFRVEWTTRPTAPPAHPSVQTVLLVSNRKADPAPISGAPGCWLMAHADHILVPKNGTLLTQSGGIVEMRWTPPANLIGVPFYCQLLVADPRNAQRLTVTPLLKLVVGSR